MPYIVSKSFGSYKGIPVTIYQDTNSGFMGLKGLNGVSVPGVVFASGCGSCCYCGPFQINDCTSMTEHLMRYLDTLTQYPANGYGPHNARWPTIYLSNHQASKLLSEDGLIHPVANRVVQVASSVICTKCRFKNDYGAPNQKDGSYVCYMCR